MERAAMTQRCLTATFAPAGSNRSGRGGNEAAEAFGVEDHIGDLASTQTAAIANAVQAPKGLMWKRPGHKTGKAAIVGEASEEGTRGFHRGSGGGMRAQGDRGNTGSPME